MKDIDKVIPAIAMVGFVMIFGFYVYNMPNEEAVIEYNKIEFNSTDSSISDTYLNYVLTESKDFKTFVERERKQHQTFLEWTYKTGLALIGFAIALLGYIGFRIKEDAKEKLEALKKEAIEKAKLEFDKNIKVTFDNELQNTKADLVYLKNLIEKEIYWDNAKILVIGAKHDKGKVFNQLEMELEYIKNRKVDIDKEIYNSNLDLNSYDLILYKYTPLKPQEDKPEEDQDLIDLIEKMEKLSMMPLVVYAPEKDIPRDTYTNKAVFAYKHQILAKSIFSLWSNTFDALMVKRTLKNNDKTA